MATKEPQQQSYDVFLEINGYQKTWAIPEQIELVLKIESDIWKVDEIENWLRDRVKKI